MNSAIEKARMSGDLDLALSLIKEESNGGRMTVGLTHQYALTLMASGKYTEALDALLLAVSKAPQEGQLWLNIAQCSEAIGDWDNSLRAYDACLKTPNQPNEWTARAHFGRGSNLFRLGATEWGIRAWRKGLAFKNVPEEARFQRSQALLAFGEWAEGFAEYESRKRLPGWRTGVKGHGVDIDNLPPEWDGKAEGRVLCYAEQGAGDVIMFARYVPQGSVFVTGKDMRPFFPDTHGECLWSAPVGSLPLLLGATAPIPPLDLGYLKQANAKPRIGVCWRGSQFNPNDKDRSSPYDFRKALQDERWEIVSLQAGRDFEPKSYLDTANLMRTLDAVVTVDTSVVHVAGNLGIPTIIIPGVMPDWRWSISGSSAWYPNVKIVRRTKVDAWPDAIRRAKREVANVI